ncbi:cation:proton antiporter domain-containing protein [Aliikangiella sp. IMCC44632]
MVSHYLIDFVILLTAAVVIVPIAQALKVGTVPGFLFAGFMVGPNAFGLIARASEVSVFAEIGVVFLLFIIGIEMKPSRIWQMRRLVFGVGALQLLLTGAVIGLFGYWFIGFSLDASFLIGLALALSSTAFVLQLLTESKSLTATYGRTSFAILLLQDLAVVPLLAIVPLLVMPEITFGAEIGMKLLESLFVVAAVVIVGQYLLHPVLHRVAQSGSPEIFTTSAVLIVLGAALLTEHAGLSMAMGAFLAGLLISDSSYRHQVKAEIQPFRGLLLGLFFMSMGMSFNLSLLLDEPVLMLGLVIGLVLIKVLVLLPIALVFGIERKNALAVALVLAQSGEFALVLFALARQSKIVDDIVFQQLILIVLLSMLLTPLLAYVAEKVSKLPEEDELPAADSIKNLPVLIAGYGRVGHRLGEILTRAEVPFVAIDLDATVVKKQRKRGIPIFYGDVTKPALLSSAGASQAKVIIVTVNEPEATKSIVASLRNLYPKTELLVRAHDQEQSRQLMQLGASHVISENFEASMELSSMVLTSAGVERTKSRHLIAEFRAEYIAKISE